jgi:hypothetical protein
MVEFEDVWDRLESFFKVLEKGVSGHYEPV